MEIAGQTIAVCDWSIRGRSVVETVQCVKALGLEHVHLALSPLVKHDHLACDEAITQWKASGLQFTAGMIGFDREDYTSIESIRRTGGLAPDAEWAGRRHWIELCLGIAHKLGMTMISTHIGFVPAVHQQAYSVMVGRVQEVAELFWRQQICLLMETGQERAGELLEFIKDVARPNVGVNFDPANMILYGAGDPAEAVRTLGHHILHVHVKDAMGSPQPGIQWGREVPFGMGQVDPKRFIRSLAGIGYKNSFAIEREGGHNRAEEVGYAIRRLEQAFVG